MHNNIKVHIKKLIKIFGSDPETALKKLESGVAASEIFERSDHVIAVNNVSIDVVQGETFVVMGLSGSGKSTLIRCINLLTRPTAGSIYIDGEDVVSYKKSQVKDLRQTKVGMVFQQFGLFSHRNVIGNVEWGLEVRGIPKKKRLQIAKDTISSVGLEGWENKFPGELSGGMKQRVGLARALANDPDILLMDEPFGALDPLIRRDMHVELIEMQSKIKKTIIFITHDLKEAFKIGDRIAIMKDGMIDQVGTSEDILNSPASEYVKSFIHDYKQV